ncbi:hypothetical protein [Acidisoma sp.]|uniref:hypothetical protein n=1 Tax=Acidisoma sp. TaxID=1872115 RepID=UPI003AFFD002
MAEHEDTSAALRRLEAALNRIAAQIARPRPSFSLQNPATDDPAREGEGEPAHHEIVTKLDDLIGGLRNALGIERQP